MKIKSLLLIFLLFTTTYVQAQWELQLDVQNFTHLDRIHFIDENYGWAIGGSTIGAVSPYFYTTDGGENWYLDDDWWNIQGTDIVFVNPDTGFIAAPDGIILKTIDSGEIWTDIQTPATQDVMRLFFVDENNGWATLNNFTDSSQIVHTMDGGNNWYAQQVFEINTSSILPIYFLNDSVGYGGGGYYDIENDDSYSCIVKTQNKGETWENIYLSQNTFYSISDIYFKDTLVGWAVGSKPYQYYLILMTEDGGETWQEDTLPELTNWYGNTTEASIVYSIQFENDTLGWLTCGDEYGNGYILLTTDGGETWQQQFNYWQPIYDICMLNQDTGWAVGGDFVYFTANGTYIPVSIEEKMPENKFIKITPNPANGIFTIKINYQSSIINYQLTDITGKTIMSRGHVPLQIDISSQPKGVYFITIQFQLNNQIYFLTKKIIKL